MKLVNGLFNLFDSESLASPPTNAEYHHAFRTIITMLSFIESPTPSTSETGPIGFEKKDCKNLRVLDALSAILVREHEIVAAVAEPYPGPDLQVLVSVSQPCKAEPLLQPVGKSGSIFKRWFNNIVHVFGTPEVGSQSSW